MTQQVFLGGTCGNTTWRKDIAIPALKAVGITYYDPQLGLGEWTEACEAAEMKAKAEAEVLLFIIAEETRGVASVAEVSYLLAAGRPLALALTFISEEISIDAQIVTPAERDDLNRGRIFVRTMAEHHGVPVFTTVEDAVQYAIDLVKMQAQKLTLEDIQTILENIKFRNFKFVAERAHTGFHLQLCAEEMNTSTNASSLMYGRKWFFSERASKNDIVRTAFKAVVTWQEHEARELFQYQNVSVFSPHFSLDNLIALSKQMSYED